MNKLEGWTTFGKGGGGVIFREKTSCCKGVAGFRLTTGFHLGLDKI